MRSIDELGAALDSLLAVELGELTDGELAEAHLALDVAAARFEAARARVAAAFDARRTWAADGHRSAASWLAHRRRRSRTGTAAVLGLARRLERMPATRAAMASGAISIEHARELAGCRDFSAEHFVGDEESLVAAAREQRSWPNFLRVLDKWKTAVDHHRREDAADRLHDRRRLVLTRRSDGSLAFQDGKLDPLGAEAFLHELERIERELFEQDWTATEAVHGVNMRASLLPRTRTQRLADALVEMAHRSRTAPADGQRPVPLISVYVDYQTIAGRLCELSSGVPVTTDQAISLFGRADFERVVFGPGNRVIELGIRQRFYTGGLRRAIELRDRHCQWPGCDEPAPRCEVDHRIPYAEGGCTTQRNGRLLCGFHNRLRNRLKTLPPEWAGGADEEDDPDVLAHRCRQRVRELVAAPA